jgi:radical SAM protein with 4Fe4S-binding SPASM domain
MGLAKDLRRDPSAAHALAACLQDARPYRLLEMKLYLTRRCNLRCAMCTAWNSYASREEELTTDEIHRLVAEAHALGLETLKLFGGEPMLRRDLEDIVAHASRLGVRPTLITNGTLLTASRAEALVAAGIAALDLSLDSPEPARHDAIRGVPGAWARTTEGLRHIQAAARAHGRRVAVRVNAVVMRDNYADLPQLVDLLHGWDVDAIALSPAVAQHGDASYLLAAEDRARYNREIAPRIAAQPGAARIPGGRDGLYLYGTTGDDFAHAAVGHYTARLRIGTCFKPWYYTIVRENGDVVGCNTVKDPAARIGNVRQAPLETLWSSGRYAAFRARCRPPQFADCARCCYRYALVNRRVEDAL